MRFGCDILLGLVLRGLGLRVESPNSIRVTYSWRIPEAECTQEDEKESRSWLCCCETHFRGPSERTSAVSNTSVSASVRQGSCGGIRTQLTYSYTRYNYSQSERLYIDFHHHHRQLTKTLEVPRFRQSHHQKPTCHHQQQQKS
jgi:hypothetical protein